MALGLSALAAACLLPGRMALAQAAPQSTEVHFITDVMNVEEVTGMDPAAVALSARHAREAGLIAMSGPESRGG
jgi:hypothetical protein